MGPPPNLKWQPDQGIVKAALEGSEAACSELVRRYERHVVMCIYKIVHDPQRADDLTQETFAKVFEHLDQYDPKRPCGPWIFGIATYTAHGYVRVKRFDSWNSSYLDSSRNIDEAVAIMPHFLGDTPPPDPERERLPAALRQALGQLRPKYRRCVKLLLEGHSYREIARITRLPLGTVATYIRRGPEQLTELLPPLLDSSDSDPELTPA